LDVGPELRLDLRARFKTAEAARAAEPAARALIALGRKSLPKVRTALYPDAASPRLMDLLGRANDALKAATVTVESRDVRLTVRLDLAAVLPALVAELSDLSTMTNALASRERPLKELALSFHNYESA